MLKVGDRVRFTKRSISLYYGRNGTVLSLTPIPQAVLVAVCMDGDPAACEVAFLSESLRLLTPAELLVEAAEKEESDE